ncbi:aromatic acid exporter family protein [Acidaminobacter sp. JC074]|uniref:aromatic acid exporter family protein n=1 Tax=Acidaminobacter sp. JC074 TaxID=2530199 RepID=UPI001F0EE3A4|nr:aromatic acid exporter family protein [Acidaminobacter sp. JC074]MCH4887296.1 aromatic acid exporter family protein [Acidaminobacter sp. JC074]
MRWYRSIKIIIGFVAAALFAKFIGLDFYISAGIITILNLQDTKKSSVNVSVRRLIAAVIGLSIQYAMFEILGYNIRVLFIFIAVFTPLSYKFKVREGLIVNIVLASHLLVYSEVTMQHFLNEFTLVLIGVVIGLILSFHVPQKEKRILELMGEIDHLIKENLHALSMNINNLCFIDEEELDLDNLVKKIKVAREIAKEQMANYYSKDYSYYLEYFQLRLYQTHRIKIMREHLNQTFINQGQARLLSDYTYKMARAFSPENDAKDLLDELNAIRQVFENLPLPDDREGFIEQAALFSYLNDLEEFIKSKMRFIESYPNIKW